MIKKSIILAILLVSMLHITVANEDINYANVDNITVLLNITSKFSIVGEKNPKISNLDITFPLIPDSDYRQEVLEFQTNGEEKDDSLLFNFKDLDAGNYTFGYIAKLNIKNDYPVVNKKISFPLNDSYPNKDDYTKATNYIDFDSDPLINQTALSIVKNKDDLYEVVYTLAKWITDNIDYDLSVADEVVEASTTLRERRGVCDEATILFISFARSLGIPTKYISGLAYTNLENINDWGYHAWAEVYFEGFGWVPFDFTYRQYGYVDASHIKLKESLDANNAKTLYRMTSPRNSDANLLTEESKPIVTPLKILGEKDNPIDIKIESVHENIGVNSYNLIKGKITNLKNSYYTANIYLTKSPEIIGDNNQAILLKPLEEKSVYWIIKTNATVNEYEYIIYTIQADSFHVEDSTNFTLNLDSLSYTYKDIQNELNVLEKEDELKKENDLKLFCSHKPVFYRYEEVIIECNIEGNNKNHKDLKLCSFNNECKIFDLDKNQNLTQTFEFFFDKSAKYSRRITLENDETYITMPIDLEVVDKPEIIISVTEKPSEIYYDSFYNIKFRLDKVELPQNVYLTFKISSYEKVWEIDALSNPRDYTIKLRADNLYEGNNDFNIKATYQDRNGFNYTTIINDKIKVRDMNIFEKTKYWIIEFIGKIENMFS